MNARFLIVLTTLAFLGFSVSALAGKDCVDGDTRPKCNLGGGGDDHGDPPAQYCAELIAGGFDFGRQTVTRNNRGNSYSSDSAEGLTLTRPNEEDPAWDDADAWDEVFETCPTTSYQEDPIATLNVSEDWSIDNSGGKVAGTKGSQVILAFRNAYAPLYSTVDIDLFLVGELETPFPQKDGESDTEILLDEFWYYVHAHGNDGCKITKLFSTLNESKLVMKWGACVD